MPAIRPCSDYGHHNHKVRLALSPAYTCALLLFFAASPLLAQSIPAWENGLASLDLSTLKHKAGKRDPAADCELGVRYMYGRGGVSQDYVQARQWLQKAANGTFAPAQSELGLLYLNGWGVARDYMTARDWLDKAAAQSDALAQMSIGTIYFNGAGVPKDYGQALQWFQEAADQGWPDAFDMIGQIYEHGLGVAQDYVRARQSYREAANRGDTAASDHLAALNRTQHPNCDPNWSAKFDVIASDHDAMKTAVQQKADALVTRFGGMEQAIEESDKEIDSAREQIADSQRTGDQDDVSKLEALIALNEGLIDILQCRQSLSSQTTASAPAK